MGWTLNNDQLGRIVAKLVESDGVFVPMPTRLVIDVRGETFLHYNGGTFYVGQATSRPEESSAVSDEQTVFIHTNPRETFLVRLEDGTPVQVTAEQITKAVGLMVGEYGEPVKLPGSPPVEWQGTTTGRASSSTSNVTEEPRQG